MEVGGDGAIGQAVRKMEFSNDKCWNVIQGDGPTGTKDELVLIPWGRASNSAGGTSDRASMIRVRSITSSIPPIEMFDRNF